MESDSGCGWSHLKLWCSWLSEVAHSQGYSWCSWWLSSVGAVQWSTWVWPLHAAWASHNLAAGFQEWVFQVIGNRRRPSLKTGTWKLAQCHFCHILLGRQWQNPLRFKRRDGDAISQWEENQRIWVSIFTPLECLWWVIYSLSLATSLAGKGLPVVVLADAFF